MKTATRNGNGNGHAVHDLAARFQISCTFTEISEAVVSGVVSTPCRVIEVP